MLGRRRSRHTATLSMSGSTENVFVRLIEQGWRRWAFHDMCTWIATSTRRECSAFYSHVRLRQSLRNRETFVSICRYPESIVKFWARVYHFFLRLTWLCVYIKSTVYYGSRERDARSHAMPGPRVSSVMHATVPVALLMLETISTSDHTSAVHA